MGNSPREHAMHVATKAFPFGNDPQRRFLADDIERAIVAHVSSVEMKSPAQQPWSCPRCTRIYGPSVQICVPCNTAVAAREAK